MSAGEKMRRSSGWNLVRNLPRGAGVLAGALALASCGGDTGSSGMAASGSSTTEVAITGRVMGGQQPVAGATITVYEAGTTGTYGTGDTVLASTTTAADGTFSFPALSCTDPAVPVYFVATGGSPGGTGGSVANLVMSAAPGSCSLLTEQGGQPELFVNIDEVTTVAAVWSLAQFLDPTGVHLGAPASNETGLENAAATVANLADVTTGLAVDVTQGTLPTDPSAQGTSPAPTVNTLANILAMCVDSDGSDASTTYCGELFADATPPGGTAPQTVLQAALDIAENPSNNVSELFSIPDSTAPFQTPLPLQSAPADWTLVMEFSGGALAAVPASDPYAAAVDGFGDVWVASLASSPAVNSGNGFLLELSPTGAQEDEYTAGGDVNGPFALAYDPSGNLWVANDFSNSVLGVGSEGNLLGPFTGASPAIDSPNTVAADAAGDVWVASGEGTVQGAMTVLAASTYSASAYGISDGSNVVDEYNSIVFDSVNAWLGSDEGIIVQTPIATPGNPATLIFTGPADTTTYLAMDPSGNVWATYRTHGVYELVKANGYDASSYPGLSGATLSQIAVDGGGKAWIAAHSGSTSCVIVLGTDGTLQGTSSGANGCLGGGVVQSATIRALVLDASGNVWLPTTFPSAVYEVIGVAVPVVTPVIGGAAQPFE